MRDRIRFAGYADKIHGKTIPLDNTALREYTRVKNVMMDLSSDVYDQYTMRM